MLTKFKQFYIIKVLINQVIKLNFNLKISMWKCKQTVFWKIFVYKKIHPSMFDWERMNITQEWEMLWNHTIINLKSNIFIPSWISHTCGCVQLWITSIYRRSTKLTMIWDKSKDENKMIIFLNNVFMFYSHVYKGK